MLKKDEIRIRDPFVLTDKENKLYYIYGTTALKEDISALNLFHVYVSKDLENFDGPFVVFDGAKQNFWGERDYWAAEVHKYNSKYYLIGSFIADGKRRASCILSSDNPLGEFSPVSNLARTPEEWDSLDGTLYFENDEPYLVFSHEWTQCSIGEFWAIKFSKDLTHPVEEPFMLFKASDNPYVSNVSSDKEKIAMVTDGPFFIKENGLIKMIWSSFSKGKYVVLEATTTSIRGKWTHYPPRFNFDGGHAMIFEKFNGEKYFSLHSPNKCLEERMKFIKYESK